MAVQADYLYSKGTHEKDVVDNINLTFNQTAGIGVSQLDWFAEPRLSLAWRATERSAAVSA